MELPLEKIQKDERVYFVDYSFKKDTVWQLTQILKKTSDVIWIDHHTSSFNLEKEMLWLKEIKGLRQEGISGAALTYLYLYQCDFEDLPYYIALVSDYDCWIYNYDPDTTYFKLGIETFYHDATDLIWRDLYEDRDSKYDKSLVNLIMSKGSTIKSYIDQDNNYYRNHFAYESEITGHKCLVVNRNSNNWIFGDKYSEYPLVMVWVFDGSKYSYSIFSSNKDVDCSKIAESYGGGGHSGAAGFSSDKLLFKAIKL